MNPFRECLGRSPQPILLPADDDEDQRALQSDDSDDRSHRSCGLWTLTALLPRRSQGIQLVDDADPSSAHSRTLDDYFNPNTTVGIEPLLDHHAAPTTDDEDDGKEFMRRDVFDAPDRFLSRNPFATTSNYYDDDAEFLTDHRISAAVLKHQDAKLDATAGNSRAGNGPAPAAAEAAGPEKPIGDFELGQELSDVITYDRAEPYKGDWTEMDQEESETEESLESERPEHQVEQPHGRPEPSFPILGLPRTHFSSAGMADLIVKPEPMPVVHNELDKAVSRESLAQPQVHSFLEDPPVTFVQPEVSAAEVMQSKSPPKSAGEQQQDRLFSAPLSMTLSSTSSDPLSSKEQQKQEVIPDVAAATTGTPAPEVSKLTGAPAMVVSVNHREQEQEQEQEQAQPTELLRIDETNAEASGAERRSSVAAVAQSILGDRLDDFTEKLAFIKKNIIMSLEDDDEDGWDEGARKSTARQQQEQQQQQQQQESKRRVSLDPLSSSAQASATASQVRHKRSSSLMDIAGPSIARFIHQMSGDDHSAAFSPSSFFSSLAGPDNDMNPASAEKQPVSPLPQQQQSNSTGTRQQRNHNHHMPLSSSPSFFPPVVPEEEEEEEEQVDNDEEELFDFGKMINMGRTMFSDVANRVRNANKPGNEDDDANESWTLDRDNWI